MRLLATAVAAMAATLALAVPASAALWISFDRSTVVARTGTVVLGKAVSPCSRCGPASIYFVGVKHSGLRLLRSVPRRDDARFVLVGRFGWRRGARFSFEVPSVRPGTYQLHALHRSGSGWDLAPASTMIYVPSRLFGRSGL